MAHQKNATKQQKERPQPAIENINNRHNVSNNSHLEKSKKKFINSKAKLLLPGYCKSVFKRNVAQPIINIILLYYYINKTINKRVNIEIAYNDNTYIGSPLNDILNACKEEYNKRTRCITKYFDIEEQKYQIKFRPNPMAQNDSLEKEVEAVLIIFQPTKAYHLLKHVETYLNKYGGKINIPLVLIVAQWESTENDSLLQRNVKRQMDNFCDENKFVKWFPVSVESKLNVQKCIDFIMSAIVIKRDILNMEPFGDCDWVNRSQNNIMNDVFKEEGMSKLVIVEEDAKTVQEEMREKLKEKMKNDENAYDSNDEENQGYYRNVTELQKYGGFSEDEHTDEDNAGYLQTANELREYDDAVWDAWD